MSDHAFTRLAAIAAIVAAPIAIASFLLGPAAFGWDFALLFDPAAAIRHTTASTALIRLGWILDIPGYYLLLLPAAGVLHARGAGESPLASRWAWSALLVYVVAGTIGAAALAGTTTLMDRFRSADPVAQAALVEVHVAVFGMVVDGLWNLLSMSGLAVWGLVAGGLLRHEHRWLGLFLQGIGVCAALDVVGHAAGVRTLGETGLFAYLFAFPLFTALLGVSLLRSHSVPSSRTAMPNPVSDRDGRRDAA